MSNAAIRYRMAKGMGTLDGWFDEWGESVIGGGFDFGKAFLENKYQADAIKAAGWPTGGGYPTNNPAALALQQQYALLQAQQQQQAYASGSITGAGINIGGTNISWPVLAGAALVVYLIQRPGFQRRPR